MGYWDNGFHIYVSLVETEGTIYDNSDNREISVLTNYIEKHGFDAKGVNGYSGSDGEIAYVEGFTDNVSVVRNFIADQIVGASAKDWNIDPSGNDIEADIYEPTELEQKLNNEFDLHIFIANSDETDRRVDFGNLYNEAWDMVNSKAQKRRRK